MRKRKAESATAIGRPLVIKACTVSFAQFLADKQAEPGATGLCGEEWFEDLLDITLGHASAFVNYIKKGLLGGDVVIESQGHQSNSGVLAAVAQRVVTEIGQYLFQLALVELNPYR